MKKQIFTILTLFLFLGNVFSQKIGIVYNTDEWVEFTYLTSVFSKVENQYKSKLNVIDYCANSIKNEFPEVSTTDLRPSNMISMHSKAKKICNENNLDFVISLVHRPISPDQAVDKIKYKMGSKSFGVVSHNFNKKVYYIFFNTTFHLYSK